MFDKKAFKELITKAIGDMSITEFAELCNVNRTYFSKWINEKLDSPPSPEVLKRIAKASKTVDYFDLMKVSGYFEDIEKYSEQHYNLEIDLHNEMVKEGSTEYHKKDAPGFQGANQQTLDFISDLKESGINLEKLPKDKYEKLLKGIKALWDITKD